MDPQEAILVKQRACMKWLLSKAYNNRVPENLKEPFYRDHEGKEHLQPGIIVGLGNATLYCMTLSNLYSDPNYNNRNHFSILQTLSRKGVHVHEAGEIQLTETVLIQTNPLRLNAHMSVIEALMVLYAKEIASGDRVASAISRLNAGTLSEPRNFELAFLCWVSHTCAALKRRIEQEIVETDGVDERGQRIQTPAIPPLSDFKDLCDGVCLAYLVSYYCPKIVPWTSVKVNYLPTVEDSIHNILLVSNFSYKYLPYSVFHMSPEDITFMRGTMKYNLLVLLADLFNLFEIHPAKCVMFPEMENTELEPKVDDGAGLKLVNVNEHGFYTKRSGVMNQQITQIPDLRSGLDSPTSNRPPFQVIRSPSGTQLRRATPPREQQQQHQDDGDGFVVHRSRGVPTLSSLNEPLIPARLRQAKEKSNNDSKADERGDSIPAGRPSNWGDTRHNTYAGRRSRRNSLSDESQLTIENFGGSRDQINLIGRFERRLSNTSAPSQMVIEQVQPTRSSLSDARGSIQLGYDTDSGSEKQDRDDEKTTLRRQTSVDNVSRAIRPQPQHHQQHQQQQQHSRDNLDGEVLMNRTTKYSNNGNSHNNSDSYEMNNKKTATFATLSNPTTWQQQTVHHQQSDDNDDIQPIADATKLSTIRLKLEEKRRHIEQEKRKLEAAVSKYQQKVGKAAFLQAINKDITGDHLESRWDMPIEMKKTPDLDQMDIEQYTQSIAMMNTNLHDIQNDIQRLTSQQNHITAQTLQAQQLLQAQQIANLLNQQQQQQQQAQYGSQHNVSSGYRPLNNSFGSSPHLSQSNSYSSRPPSRDPNQHVMNYVNDQGQYIQGYPQLYARENSQTQLMGHHHPNNVTAYSSNQYQQQYQQDANHYRDSYSGYQQPPEPVPPQPQSTTTFYLHDKPQQPPPSSQPTQPVAPQRRTWAQSAQMQQQQQQLQQQQPQQPTEMTTWTKSKIDTRTWKSPNQNTSSEKQQNTSGSGGGFMLHQNGGNDYNSGSGEQSYQNLFPVHASPQHRQHRQISQMMSTPETNYRDNRLPVSPAADVMAPQSISFIGDEDAGEDNEHVAPMKPMIRPRQSYSNQSQEQPHNTKLEMNLAKLNITSGNRTYRIPSPTRPSINPNSFQDPQEEPNEKGFYISFDNEQPKRPKPPLRTKRSPKKEKDDIKDKFDSKATHNYNGSEKIEEPIAAKRVFEQKQHNAPPVPADRRHLEDLTNQTQVTNNNNYNQSKNHNMAKESEAIIIAVDSALDPNSIDEMEKRKEKIMLLSLQRRQQQEEAKARKEIDAMQRREREREKEDERARKKEEQAARRAIILEQHKLKKAIEEAEREGKTVDKELLMQHKMMQQQNQQQQMPKMRTQKVVRPRPKTIHVETGSVDLSEASSLSSRGKRGSNSNITGVGLQSSNSMRRDYYRGSQDSLAMRESPDEYPSSSSTPLGRRGSYKNGRDSDSGLGRATPPRRAPSPGMGPGARHLPSPSGPGSLPPGLMTKRRIFDDGSSDISSAASSMMDYSGPRLYKQPATKSNRGIILNAVEYCVFPGAVNRDAKQKVLEKIARSEAKHFLVLFRDAGCQFRALYGYWPENETILKLYGTGPSQVDDVMFDKFFKYNSGGKCFAQVHTKHLTVTIDAFTIHNSLWQGKKVNLPSKKDMALVI